jgi:hypothetical protein
MKLIQAVVCFGTFAVAFASAGQKYDITLSHTAMVGGTSLKPGNYKVEVNGEKATISNGKSSAEAAVKVETAETKYSATGVRYITSGDLYKVEEIRVGGSKTKLVFDSGDQAAAR